MFSGIQTSINRLFNHTRATQNKQQAKQKDLPKRALLTSGEFAKKLLNAEMEWAISSVKATKASTIDLSSNWVGTKFPEVLQSVILALPKHVHTVQLNLNYLYKIPVDVLCQIFSSFGEHVTSVGLAGNNFGRMDYRKFSRFVATLNDRFESIDFSNNSLNWLLGNQQIEIEEKTNVEDKPSEAKLTALGIVLALFKPGVKHLNLSNNRLCKTNIAATLSHLKIALLSLDMSQNDLGHLAYEELARLCSSFPVASRIIFKSNDLVGIKEHFKPVQQEENEQQQEVKEEKCELFSQLRPETEYLDLSDNALGLLPAHILTSLLLSIPGTVKEINLSGNELNKQPKDVLIFIFSQLRCTKLYLDNNELSSFSADDLGEICATMSTTITSLSLENNYLAKIAKFETFPSKLNSSSLTYLNLSNNSLFRLLPTADSIVTEEKCDDNASESTVTVEKNDSLVKTDNSSVSVEIKIDDNTSDTITSEKKLDPIQENNKLAQFLSNFHGKITSLELSNNFSLNFSKAEIEYNNSIKNFQNFHDAFSFLSANIKHLIIYKITRDVLAGIDRLLSDDHRMMIYSSFTSPLASLSTYEPIYPWSEYPDEVLIRLLNEIPAHISEVYEKDKDNNNEPRVVQWIQQGREHAAANIDKCLQNNDLSDIVMSYFKESELGFFKQKKELSKKGTKKIPSITADTEIPEQLKKLNLR